MPAWTSRPTMARASVDTTLKVVDDLLSLLSTGQGKPSKKDQAVFAAAVVFSYGVWESYVEDLAIEVAATLSLQIAPAKVPDDVRKHFQSSTAWELSVHPGWKALWVEKVKGIAKGEGETYGLNTAKVKQVTKLLSTAGVTLDFSALPKLIIPEHRAESAKTVAAAVDALVELRGEIVHSGAVPKSLRKGHAREWRVFVEHLTSEVDGAVRKHCAELLA